MYDFHQFTPLDDLSHHSSENSNQLSVIFMLHSSFIIDNISYIVYISFVRKENTPVFRIIPVNSGTAREDKDICYFLESYSL